MKFHTTVLVGLFFLVLNFLNLASADEIFLWDYTYGSSGYGLAFDYSVDYNYNDITVFTGNDSYGDHFDPFESYTTVYFMNSLNIPAYTRTYTVSGNIETGTYEGFPTAYHFRSVTELLKDGYLYRTYSASSEARLSRGTELSPWRAIHAEAVTYPDNQSIYPTNISIGNFGRADHNGWVYRNLDEITPPYNVTAMANQANYDYGLSFTEGAVRRLSVCVARAFSADTESAFASVRSAFTNAQMILAYADEPSNGGPAGLENPFRDHNVFLDFRIQAASVPLFPIPDRQDVLFRPENPTTYDEMYSVINLSDPNANIYLFQTMNIVDARGPEGAIVIGLHISGTEIIAVGNDHLTGPLVAHEYGHLCGLSHNPLYPRYVMYYAIYPDNNLVTEFEVNSFYYVPALIP